MNKELDMPVRMNKKIRIKIEKNVKYSICSCGYSKKIPFCDNQHRLYNKKNNTTEYMTLGLSIDNLTELNLIEYPNLIKIDVDGNELDIINGFKKTVKEVKDVSLLVETRTLTHNKVEDELKRLGFKKVRQVNSNSIGTK